MSSIQINNGSTVIGELANDNGTLVLRSKNGTTIKLESSSDILIENSDGRTVFDSRYFGENKPCFYAYGSVGSPASGSYWTFPTVPINTGGCYNNTNGVFTAPVAGVYYFHYSSIGGYTTSMHATSVLTRHEIRVNGSTVYGGHQMRLEGVRYPGGSSRSVMLTLQEGDQVQVFVSAGTPYSSNNHYSDFGGWLVAL